MRGGITGIISETRRERIIEALKKQFNNWNLMSLEQQENLIAFKSLTFKDKYNNVKTTVDGIEFDSKKEANDYHNDIKYQVVAGKIKDLELQKEFVLLPEFHHAVTNIKCQPITYTADFYFYAIDYYSTSIRRRDGIPIATKKHLKDIWVVRDTKGMKTDVYRLKKKLFLHCYPDIYFEET